MQNPAEVLTPTAILTTCHPFWIFGIFGSATIVSAAEKGAGKSYVCVVRHWLGRFWQTKVNDFLQNNGRLLWSFVLESPRGYEFQGKVLFQSMKFTFQSEPSFRKLRWRTPKTWLECLFWNLGHLILFSPTDSSKEAKCIGLMLVMPDGSFYFRRSGSKRGTMRLPNMCVPMLAGRHKLINPLWLEWMRVLINTWNS